MHFNSQHDENFHQMLGEQLFIFIYYNLTVVELQHVCPAYSSPSHFYSCHKS
jgi:hypothetical protein